MRKSRENIQAQLRQAEAAEFLARKAFAISLLALCVGISHGSIAFAETKLFENATESTTRGWVHVSEALAKSLFSGPEGHELLARQAIKNDRLSDNLHQFLVQKKIPISIDKKKKFLLIRPPTEPYHSILYGAHAYTFWLTSPYRKVIFHGTGDEFSVLGTTSNGMRDIEVMNAFGGLAYRARFAFDGSGYRPKGCSTESIQDDRQIDGCEPVDYEEFERRLKTTKVISPRK